MIVDQDEKKRKEMFCTFWEHYENKIGYVPTKMFKKAIEDSGRANQFGFTKLRREMLEEGGYILTYIRTDLHKTLQPWYILQYYETKYVNNPDQFLFESGELDTVELALELINKDKTFFDGLIEEESESD